MAPAAKGTMSTQQFTVIVDNLAQIQQTIDQLSTQITAGDLSSKCNHRPLRGPKKRRRVLASSDEEQADAQPVRTLADDEGLSDNGMSANIFLL